MIDELDARLISLLAAEPRIGVLEASKRLGVARGTVQARLDRLHRNGVVTGYRPDVDPVALDHERRQNPYFLAIAHLAQIYSPQAA